MSYPTKRHTPVVIIQDLVGTPHLSIVIRCRECDVIVTERPIDVSKVEAARAGDFASVSGEEDGFAWLAHAQADNSGVN